MRIGEDTPADGFARPAGTPGTPGTPDVPGARRDAPFPRRRPGASRPARTAADETETSPGAPWGPAPEPSPSYPASWPPGPPPAPPPGSEPAGPRTRGRRPAQVRSDEPGLPGTGPRPGQVRSDEPGLPGTGSRPGQVRSAESGPRRPEAPPARVRSGEPAPRAGAAAVSQVPYLVFLACAVGGIVWAWRGSHDVGNGAGVVGGALLAAAVARLVLPESAVGLLASRRRFADVLALGILGAGLLVLALVLPPT